MSPDKIKILQQHYKKTYGIGVVEFAETLLCTKYDTYKKWMNGTNAIPGIAVSACAFLAISAELGLTLEQIEQRLAYCTDKHTVPIDSKRQK